MTTWFQRLRAGRAIRGLAVGIALALGGWTAHTVLASRSSGPDESVSPGAGAPSDGAITALGRLEPRDGVIRIAGPSRPSVVIAELRIGEGDPVEAGQVLAVLDTRAEEAARVRRLRAELANAQADLARQSELHARGMTSVSVRDAFRLKVDVAQADLEAAEAALRAAEVRAPVAGRVLRINARSGEHVGPLGIAELGQTEQMYAVAEVYETDVGGVRPGQRATVTSRALATPLEGTVEQVGLLVGRLEAVSTDPAESTDARIVKVKIRLDDSRAAAAFTNLQVEVAIHPEGS